ncbi:mechanosensitive ion channel family protein [Pedobacter alpinus]|uniref:Mechanosensitive ion channel family protein n=1 Tax=Pedobacter alpinus TaxID=1590643 RepID=A0ABW5TSA8_9SPHI
MHKKLYKHLLLVVLCLGFNSLCYGQSIADSLINRINGTDTTEANKANVVVDSTYNTLINRIDFYTTSFNDITKVLNDGFDTLDISEGLPLIEERLEQANKYKLLTYRSINTSQDYFATAQKQLTKWDERLSLYNGSLIKMRELITGLTTDSTFQKFPEDSVLRERFFIRLNALGGKWQKIDSISNKAALEISFLQTRISVAQAKVDDFNEEVILSLKRLNEKTFTKEYDYLWDVNFDSFFSDLIKGIKTTIRINSRVLTSYIIYSYKVHIINLLLFVLLAVWLNKNRNILLKAYDKDNPAFEHANLVSKYPTIAALAVTCTLGPFFYYHPPIILNQIYLIVLMICVGALMPGVYPKWAIKYWFLFLVFVVLFSFGNLYFQVFSSERIVYFGVTILVILASLRLFKKYFKLVPVRYKSWALIIAYSYFALLATAFLGNIFGRYNVAKIAGTTGLFTLVETICLILCVKIITEGIFLQMEVGKIHINRISSYLDFKNLKNRIGKLLRVISVFLMLIYFTQNLNVFDSIYTQIKDFLVLKREIGNNTYTFLGFFLFIFIIYISTVISKVISYFLEFADQHAESTSRRAKYSSSILLVRLSIWIIGFLIGIAASGIPLDKLTIILGALGVGIGFGLQNIVNNVVSGIVMVFEKPIQVGDLIQVENETGTVRSMGIRASKILTLEGSEVIIPNGDLLSKNLINWTLSNTNKRVTLEVGVAYGTDIDKVKEIFQNIIDANEKIIKVPAPAIILDSFGDNSVNFKVFCWVSDIDNWLRIKSMLMSSVFEEFYKQDIKIPFPQRDLHIHFSEEEQLKKIISKPDKEE